MARPPFPIRGRLVPEVTPAMPDGFTLIDQAMLSGFPQIIPLDQGTRLVLSVPTGLAKTWLQADPTIVISHSEGEYGPFESSASDGLRAPARLALQIAERTVSVAPLVAGRVLRLPGHGAADRGATVDLLALSWSLAAGSLRGPGDYGSRIRLAWRRADLAIERYSTPPPNPHLVPRLPPKLRLQSTVGLHLRLKDLRLHRFAIKKVFLP